MHLYKCILRKYFCKFMHPKIIALQVFTMADIFMDRLFRTGKNRRHSRPECRRKIKFNKGIAQI